MNFEAIAALLRQKKPRLLIALAQAGNPLVTAENAYPVETAIEIAPKAQGSDYQLTRFDSPYADLFLNVSGEVLASAAKPGRYALYSEEMGIFTWALINALPKSGQNWENLLKNMDQVLEGNLLQSTNLRRAP